MLLRVRTVAAYPIAVSTVSLSGEYKMIRHWLKDAASSTDALIPGVKAACCAAPCPTNQMRELLSCD
jgi:hypothetical protein